MAARSLAAAAAAIWLASSCAYYNTFYYARQHWAEAEKARLELPEEPPSKKALDLYEKCMKKCAKVLTDYDGSRWVDDALLMMGRCAVERGEYATGLRKFQELIEFYPKSPLVPEARLAIGMAQREEGSLGPAAVALQAVLDDPADRELHNEARLQLGLTRLAAGDSAGAVEMLEQFANDAEDHPEWRYALETIAEVQLARGEPAAARAAYDRMRPHPRRDWPAYRSSRLAIGRTYRIEGKMDEARRVYEALLPLTRDIRDSAEIWEEMGLIARDEGNDSLAVEIFGETADRFGRTDGAARSLYARAELLYHVFGDIEGARRSFDSVSVHTGSLPEVARAKEEAAVLGERLSLDEQLVMLLQRLAAASQMPPDSGTRAPDPAGAAAPAESIAAPVDSVIPGAEMVFGPAPEPSPAERPAIPPAGPASRVEAPTDSLESPAAGPAMVPAGSASRVEVPAAPVESLAVRPAVATGSPPPPPPRPDAGSVPKGSALPAGPAAGARPDSATGMEPSISATQYLAELSDERRSELFAIADSATKEQLAGVFLRIGEVELLKLDRMERALVAYETVVIDFAETQLLPQALLSLAWIHEHRLERSAEAEELYLQVLNDYPGTRFAAAAGLALEIEGAVPDSVLGLLAVSLEPPEPTEPARAEPAPVRAERDPAAEGDDPGSEPMRPPPGFGEDEMGRAAWPDSLGAWPDSLAARRDTSSAGLTTAPPPIPGQEPPRVLSLATPIMPQELLDAGIRGSVTVDVTVGPAGLPTDARVTRSDNPDLDGAAVVAALNTVFAPPHGQDHASITFTFPPEEQ